MPRMWPFPWRGGSPRAKTYPTLCTRARRHLLPAGAAAGWHLARVLYRTQHAPAGHCRVPGGSRAQAARWACESDTPGASTAADLAAEAAMWEDSLALIEIHPGARCELLPAEETSREAKRWIIVERPIRARAVDTAYGRWLCTVQGQRWRVASPGGDGAGGSDSRVLSLADRGASPVPLFLLTASRHSS